MHRETRSHFQRRHTTAYRSVSDRGVMSSRGRCEWMRSIMDEEDSKDDLLRGNSRGSRAADTVSLASSPLSLRAVISPVRRWANTACMHSSTHRCSNACAESQLPFETVWCVNKHMRAFQPNKTNFQSSTNTVGPIMTLAFLFFLRGTAQLMSPQVLTTRPC